MTAHAYNLRSLRIMNNGSAALSLEEARTLMLRDHSQLRMICIGHDMYKVREQIFLTHESAAN